MPWSSESPTQCWGALCVCWSTLQHSAGHNSAFASLTDWAEPQGQPGVREWDPFRSSLDMYTALHTHVLSRSLGICWRISEPLWAAHLLDFIQVFVLIFLFRFSCLLQLVLAPQAAVMLKNCCWVFLASTLGKGLFPVSELCIRSNKDKPQVCVFPESQQTVIILWEWALGEFQICSASTVADTLHKYCCCEADRFLRPPWAWGNSQCYKPHSKKN